MSIEVTFRRRHAPNLGRLARGGVAIARSECNAVVSIRHMTASIRNHRLRSRRGRGADTSTFEARSSRKDHFALPWAGAGDGAGPQANRNPGEAVSMLGIIVEIIGEEAAAKLIASFGGTRLYVPHSPCANDALARAVGAGAAMKLAEMFGGERVELPKPPPRRTQILALRAAGRSVEEIARAMSCTRRRVFQVLAEARRELCSGGTSI